MQVHGSPVQGDSLTTVAGDALDREPAGQTPDYAELAKNLDKKSPLEIMDEVFAFACSGRSLNLEDWKSCVAYCIACYAGLETTW